MNTCGLNEVTIKTRLKQHLQNQVHSISTHDLELIIRSVAMVLAENNRKITNDLDNELRQRIPRGF